MRMFKHVDEPAANNVEVVVNALVVDVRALLEQRHGDFGIANAFDGSGHTGGQPPCRFCSALRVEHCSGRHPR